MKLLLLLLIVGCGRTIKTGSVEKTQEPQVTSTQLASCTPPRNPEILYFGVPCRLHGPTGVNYSYICANNRTLLVDCSGRIL